MRPFEKTGPFRRETSQYYYTDSATGNMESLDVVVDLYRRGGAPGEHDRVDNKQQGEGKFRMEGFPAEAYMDDGYLDGSGNWVDNEGTIWKKDDGSNVVEGGVEGDGGGNEL